MMCEVSIGSKNHLKHEFESWLGYFRAFHNHDG